MNGHDFSRRRFLQASGYGLLAGATAATLIRPASAQDAPKEPANKKVGYALVGLGRLSIGQLLPAFAQCKDAKVTALVSGHPDKAKDLAGKYGVAEKSIYSYENFDSIKDNPDVDVVYIVLPNSMHCEYTVRAAKAGKHVLCEKPMAVSVAECQQMIDACKAANRKLMIGYRLRHEPHNMKAIEICREKTYGPVRAIQAEHSFNIGRNEWRTDTKLSGGGPVLDLGVYCINAFRYLTGEEPKTVSAQTFQPKDDPRFVNSDGTMAFTLKFPSGILAAGTTSYMHHYAGRFAIDAQTGVVTCDPAFSYGGLKMHVRARSGEMDVDLPNNNHFAAEMDHFADCVLNDKPPITPGEEGLADIKVIRKLYESAETGKTVEV
jgi:predicted dehydrogenase